MGRFRFGEVSFRPRHGDCIVLSVDYHQRIPGFDDLLIVHQNLFQVAADTCANRMDVPIDLGVISRFIAFQISPQRISAH